MAPQLKPPAVSHHDRNPSFSGIEAAETTGILSHVFHEAKVYLGGSALGQGLTRAAQYYLQCHEKKNRLPLDKVTEDELAHQVDCLRFGEPEDSFYVVDLGVVVSQVYQWRKCFPRVEPFYAVKCNPDPVIVRTLATLGLNFDCASTSEIRLVQQIAKDLPRQPDIIFANPTKAPSHIREAVARGVRLMTFDNLHEISKCAAISKDIQLILRIVTDDRGSQCRLSSKFGAPRHSWRPLLAKARKVGLEVVGVSFHVGSGCRDATRYELALRDAREIFDVAREYGFYLHLLDIGGGFPGETHSLWNPAEVIDDTAVSDGDESLEGKSCPSLSDHGDDEPADPPHFMFFHEIAEQVSPVIDQLFPPDSGVRIIAEPGRYCVAACATLCTNVIAMRTNEVDDNFELEPIDDQEQSKKLALMSRDEELELVRGVSERMVRSVRSLSIGGPSDMENVLDNMMDELQTYSRLFAHQNLAQQETDVYNDALDFYKEDFETATDLLGAPTEDQQRKTSHTVEGMNYPLMAASEEEPDALITLAAAGEAAVSGICMQAVADTPLQDDIAYTINNGVYSAFNNIMFDHANVRPRVLRDHGGRTFASINTDSGLYELESTAPDSANGNPKNQQLYSSTVFGNTCDSIDVIVRSTLLPRLKIGDWMYFQNMGAYTMAASSNFNGFQPSEKFYVCSVQPEYFEALIAGPNAATTVDEEKKIEE